MNRLVSEKSPYLRHASSQPVDWYPWGDEAFDRARLEGKPVFLSSGAVWCHWCHVMAQESFEDRTTADLMNGNFVCVKLDRDERPDIDRRYQQAVAAMGGGSGWPLSVFLTPERQPFFGGTYFPPEDRQGRPGFRRVLQAVSAHYSAKRADAEHTARQVADALMPEPITPGDLSEAMLAAAETAMLDVEDRIHGGFGTAPKFPMPGALEFLIRRSCVSKDQAVGRAARRMLDAMERGGIHDHLGGGFHRYSVDESWIIPHFEKMADDNAGLLRNYADGYAVFGDPRYRDAARGILSFTRGVLADPGGGFYASQDADVTPDDEGGYFTWTDAEIRKALDPDEYPLVSMHLVHEQGGMHHDPAKKVLFSARPVREIAERLGLREDDAARIIGRGMEKLLHARQQRTAPFLDRTLYTSLNGMLISAWFHAFAVLGDPDMRTFALRSLERILDTRFMHGRLLHCEEVPATLDDSVHLADALIAAYESTADRQYLARAADLMSDCMQRFSDPSEGGFFDTETEVLGTRLKRIEDVPHPSANARAIVVLLKLALLTGRDELRGAAEQVLRLFAGTASTMGVHGGSYFAALDAYYRMIKLVVEAPVDSELARAARFLKGKAPVAIVYGDDRDRVIPCRGNICLEPVQDPVRLLTLSEMLS